MSEDKNFSFSGFPMNEEIEIPDPRPSKSKAGDPRDFLNQLGKMNPEELKKMLPPEALEELNEIAEQTGSTIDEMLSGATATAQQLTGHGVGGMMKMVEQMMNEMFGLGGMPGEDDCDCDDCDDDCDCHHAHYELADAKYLNPEMFGSIECVEDPDLYEHFVDKYGTDSTKYLDPNLGIKAFEYTALTASLPLQNVKNLKFLEANNRFILFYAEVDIPDTYGFFVAFFKTEDDYSMYIPEFRNTFDVQDGVAVLFNPAENEAMFTIDPNGSAMFDQLCIPSIEFAINFALAPKKRTLLNPHQFGTIKNTMPSVKKDSMFLKVGNITSNESSEAILLKKDAELELSETTFPLYFNFGRVVDKESLMEVAQIIFKTDLNNCKLLDNCELKYTNDHRLYIDIDLGDF